MQPPAGGGGLPVAQLLPLIIVFGSSYVDLEPHTQLLRAAYLVVVLGSVAALVLIRSRIVSDKKSDDNVVRVPEQKMFGQVQKPAEVLTEQEYDLGKWKEQATQVIVGAVVLTFVHMKWEMVMPLLLQTATVPVQLCQSPLFSIYIRGQPADGALTRPWAAPSLFPGLPSPPEGGQDQGKQKDRTHGAAKRKGAKNA
eukprot:TRINITY_DN23002_c0_g2_i1.p2 TRINITY_DN23002_c0_g2~~TRINITY_DN23002_c0_g2_i1.p2  ORF type:complete len:220 (+),score=66.39 TRINITY_DN23002_c0_g2_i1:71-661(+)